jgi:hypothetical protein
MVKCQTCGGMYARVQDDGMQYFHACPPLSVAELKDAIAKNAVQLSASQQQQLDAARAADLKRPPAADEIPAVDVALSAFAFPRPLHRDENIKVPAIDKRPAVIVAAGKGEPIVVP